MPTQDCDVVVVGAGIAGCTAAIAYARAGLHVILIEAHRDVETFKRACTHLIQASAVPTLQRLGIAEELEAAGGVRTEMQFHTPAGWVCGEPVREGAGATYGYNIPRSRLDPLLRRLATDKHGVELVLGARVKQLERRGGRVAGVQVSDGAGGTRAVRTRLVVGADGRHSAVAAAAGVPSLRTPHGRFGYFAHFADVLDSAGRLPANAGDEHGTVTSRLWLRDPDIAYLLPNGDRTVLATMLGRERMAEARRDFDTHIHSVFENLPDGPTLDGAQRISPFVPVKNYSNVCRVPVARGLALIGDAALVTDYLWGAGCGWAFQAGEWLADATIERLRSGGDLAPALGRFAWSYFRRMSLHQVFNSSFATGRRMNAFERMLFRAATRDTAVAAGLAEFGNRKKNPIEAFPPQVLARAVRRGGEARSC